MDSPNEGERGQGRTGTHHFGGARTESRPSWKGRVSQNGKGDRDETNRKAAPVSSGLDSARRRVQETLDLAYSSRIALRGVFQNPPSITAHVEAALLHTSAAAVDRLRFAGHVVEQPAEVECKFGPDSRVHR